MSIAGSLTARLNERADQKGTGTLGWYLKDGRTLYLGPSNYLPDHIGGAPVLLVGLYGAFRLRVESGDWRVCRSAVIPPGLVHALDFGGDPIATLYIEPDIGGVSALVPLIGNGSVERGAIVGGCGEVSYLRNLFEGRPAKQQVDEAVAELLNFSKRRSREDRIDPRIRRTVQCIRTCSEELTPAVRLAEAVGLSSSRFQHLFSLQVGVPYRRYRSWSRMRVAIGEIALGRSCTIAAHAAGYADLAHFTRDCRRTFGGVFTRQYR